MSPPAKSVAVRIRLALAWAAMAWERLWIGLWPVATFLAFAAALALTDVFPSLPPLLHLVVLIAIAAAAGALGWRGLRGFLWPQRAEARARLEAASPVSHRPLTTAEDSLAAGASPLQMALWWKHQARARAALKRLRSPWPAPDVARRDGFALRAVAILLLAVALVGTGRDAPNRLARAVTPALGEGAVPVTVKLWITPPAYTNQAPLYLEVPSAAAAPKQIDVAAGSKALVVVTGTHRATTLSLTAPKQPATVVPLSDMNAADASTETSGSHRAELVLPQANRLEVRQGARVLAGWDINWLPDEAPSIAFAAPPRDVGRGRLRIDYTARDDHGLQAVTGTITRPGSDDRIEIALSVPMAVSKEAGPKDTAHTSTHDIGAHPWAGLKASLTLTATDQAGQSATTEAVAFTMPERTFSNPVAQEIARWRKDLAADPEKNAEPAANAFARLLDRPGAYNGDRVVFLALSSAKYRLIYQTPQDALHGMPELLWQTAVRIEDGNLGAAEQRLEAAEQALKQALEQNASPDEVSRLVDDLRRALADYTRALAERMPNKGGEMAGMDKQGKMVSPNDIAQAMEQLRKLSQMGAQDAAKQMLSQLQNMLQTLRNAAAGDMGDNAEMKQAEQLMQQMREMTEKQSQLLNESFDQVRQNAIQAARQNGNQKGDQNARQKAAEKQQQLRQQLGELMGKMSNMTGQTPGAMGEADGAMRNAEKALQAGAWKSGAEAQGQALSKMESGMQEASQQMMQAMSKNGMSGLVQMPGQRNLNNFGPRNGADDGEQVDVPSGPDTEGMSQRVRAILEEIRRRASDRTRPAAEQEYLRRLMKEF